jgi:hypothetical protein
VADVLLCAAVAAVAVVIIVCVGLLDAALSHDDCSVVLTTYEQLRLQRELLLPVRWGVAVLDEGHKIRNPDAEVGTEGQHKHNTPACGTQVRFAYVNWFMVTCVAARDG